MTVADSEVEEKKPHFRGNLCSLHFHGVPSSLKQAYHHPHEGKPI